MFQQIYEPHPALKGFVNNIMIHGVKADDTQAQLTFFIPPLPAHGLIFYVRDLPDSEDMSAKKKKQCHLPSLLVQMSTGILLLRGLTI